MHMTILGTTRLPVDKECALNDFEIAQGTLVRTEYTLAVYSTAYGCARP